MYAPTTCFVQFLGVLRQSIQHTARELQQYVINNPISETMADSSHENVVSSRSASPSPPAPLEAQHLGQLLLLLSFDTLLRQPLLRRLVNQSPSAIPPRAKVAGIYMLQKKRAGGVCETLISTGTPLSGLVARLGRQAWGGSKRNGISAQGRH